MNTTPLARILPDYAIHRGIDALRRHYARWVESYPDLTVEPLEAKGNGAPVEMELAHVITMGDGKAARTVEYFDRAEALEAAGLTDRRSTSGGGRE